MLQLVYGTPDPERMEVERRGAYINAGRVVSEGAPTWRCSIEREGGSLEVDRGPTDEDKPTPTRRPLRAANAATKQAVRKTKKPLARVRPKAKRKARPQKGNLKAMKAKTRVTK